MKGVSVRIVHNRLLGGWYIVRGPHQTPISGRFASKEAALAHLRTPPQFRRNPIKGPGKFEGETYLAKYAYENPDGDIGSVDELGWYGYLSGKVRGRGPFHIIVSENSQGFVTGEIFDTAAAMAKQWRKIEKAYGEMESDE